MAPGMNSSCIPATQGLSQMPRLSYMNHTLPNHIPLKSELISRYESTERCEPGANRSSQQVVDVTGVVVPAHQIHLHSGYRYTIHRGQVVIVVLGVVAEAGLAELGSPAIRLPGDSLPERGSSKEMMDLATASA